MRSSKCTNHIILYEDTWNSAPTGNYKCLKSPVVAQRYNGTWLCKQCYNDYLKCFKSKKKQRFNKYFL